MNHLLRRHAPLTDSNWKLLDEEAVERLEGPLAARRLVDFVGPRGWEHSATNLGRTEAIEAAEEGVSALRRRVMPLVEVRVDFTVSRAEMRDDDRGAVDVDLESLDNAAHQIAIAENSAVFNGWARAGIQGVVESSPFEPEPLGAGQLHRAFDWCALGDADQGGGDVLGRLGLEEDRRQQHRPVPGAEIGDAGDELEELRRAQDRPRDGGGLDRLLLGGLGAEVATALQPVGADDRQRDVVAHLGRGLGGEDVPG